MTDVSLQSAVVLWMVEWLIAGSQGVACSQPLAASPLPWADSTRLCSCPLPSPGVNTVQFSPDGQLLVSGSDDMQVRCAAAWVRDDGASAAVRRPPQRHHCCMLMTGALSAGQPGRSFSGTGSAAQSCLGLPAGTTTTVGSRGGRGAGKIAGRLAAFAHATHAAHTPQRPAPNHLLCVQSSKPASCRTQPTARS